MKKNKMYIPLKNISINSRAKDFFNAEPNNIYVYSLETVHNKCTMHKRYRSIVYNLTLMTLRIYTYTNGVSNIETTCNIIHNKHTAKNLSHSINTYFNVALLMFFAFGHKDSTSSSLSHRKITVQNSLSHKIKKFYMKITTILNCIKLISFFAKLRMILYYTIRLVCFF